MLINHSSPAHLPLTFAPTVTGIPSNMVFISEDHVMRHGWNAQDALALNMRNVLLGNALHVVCF